jgi:DNA topoisomerase-2
MSKKINEVVTQLDENEHMKTKNVTAGSHKLVTIPSFTCFDSDIGFYKQTNFKYVPAIYKCIDEAIVNAIDHFINCITENTINHACNEGGSKRKMDMLEFSIDNNCIIKIKNNGYGIPVELYDPDKFPGVHTAEFIYTIPRTGTYGGNNFRITGGTNGLGSKIIVFKSKKFKYSGQDGTKKLEFVADIDKKGVVKIKSKTESAVADDTQYTFLQFQLDLAAYGKHDPRDQLYQYALKRLVQSYLYMNLYSNCCVKLNDKNIAFSADMLAKNMKLSEIFKFNIIAPEECYGENQQKFRVFKMMIGINEYSKKNNIQISIINGIEVSKNPIVAKILESIFDKIKEKLAKTTKSKIQFGTFKNRITTFFVGAIPNPEWTDQMKDEFSLLPGYLQKLKYEIPQDLAEKYAVLLSKYFILDQSRTHTTKLNSEKYDISIHTPADDWRGNKKTTKYLIITEGDSAQTFINRLLSQKGNMLNMDNSGRFKLGGVPMNTYHRMTIQKLDEFKNIADNVTDKSVILMDEKCQTNNVINVLLRHAMGIPMNINGSIIDKMKYDYYIIASDQDLDGWNINGLLLVFFSKFPELFEQKRILRLQTPVARIKPKDLTKTNAADSIEFYSTEDLEEWLRHNKVPSGMEIKYYKGLGSNDKEYAPALARDIKKYLYYFYNNKGYESDLARYYDKENPNLRKQELSTPVQEMSPLAKKFFDTKHIPISTFLKIFVKQYQLYNLGRKLLNVMGGQNRVTNKIMYGLDKIFTSNNTSIKVALAGNKIIDYTNYPHGEKSVYDAIFNQAQQFPGSTNLYNMMRGIGEFGSRLEGGKDHVDPRYGSIKYNRDFKRALYKQDDDCVLMYQYEENEKIDPLFQLPVVPIVLFRNYSTTAHGWKIQIWARDVRTTINALIKLINGQEVNYELPMNMKNINSPIISVMDGDIKKVYSRSKFIVDGNIIRISELPLGIWNMQHKATILEKAKTNPIMKEIFEDYVDKSEVDGDCLNIRIELKEGWEAKIPKKENPIFSDIELFFRLRFRLCDALNLISPDGSVIEFRNYIDILKYWYEERKKFYIIRITRQIEIMKNKILVQDNICRYLQNKKWGLSKEETKKLFESLELVKINLKLIQPDYFVETQYIQKFLLVSKDQNELPEEEIKTYNKLKEMGVISGYASYEYLNSIRTDQLRKDRLSEKLAKLEKLQEKLKILQSQDRWKAVWLEEISALKSYMI